MSLFVIISGVNLRPLDTQCKHIMIAVFLLFVTSIGKSFLSHKTNITFFS